jgi:hypothetical protein
MVVFITRNLHRVFAASLLVALVVIAMVMNTVVHAQSTGLGVVPRKDVSVKAGETFEDKLYVTNLNKSASLKIAVSIVDFSAANQTGSTALKLNVNADPTPWSLKPFVKVPAAITLAPGETKNVPYTITIPKNQGAGSYYSAVRYTAVGEGGQNVTVSASAATLVFVTVPGKATEQMSLQKFGPYVPAVTKGSPRTEGRFQSFFVSNQPTVFAYLLRNNGNVAESPAGSIEITNIFGKQTRLIKDANPKSNLALIGQERRFEVCIAPGLKEVDDNGIKTKVDYCKDPQLLPGVYKAHLNVFYGINGSTTQEIDKTVIFWYMPYWAIAVLLAILAIIAFGIYKLRAAYVTYRSHR